jgi:hypothetical protein
MMRSEFTEAVRRIAPDLSPAQAAAIATAADQYAAHLIEKALRPPDRLERNAS